METTINDLLKESNAAERLLAEAMESFNNTRKNYISKRTGYLREYGNSLLGNILDREYESPLVVVDCTVEANTNLVVNRETDRENDIVHLYFRGYSMQDKKLRKERYQYKFKTIGKVDPDYLKRIQADIAAGRIR